MFLFNIRKIARLNIHAQSRVDCGTLSVSKQKLAVSKQKFDPERALAIILPLLPPDTRLC